MPQIQRQASCRPNKSRPEWTGFCARNTDAVRGGLFQLLGHREMLLEMRQRLGGPALELRIVAALRIVLEQRYRLLVAFELVLIIGLVEVLARQVLQLVELALVLPIERRWQLRLYFSA